MFFKRLGQGRDRALQYLRENPQLSDEIEQVCLLVSYSVFTVCMCSFVYSLKLGGFFFLFFCRLHFVNEVVGGTL